MVTPLKVGQDTNKNESIYLSVAIIEPYFYDMAPLTYNT